jgi:hypothetical protein
MSKREQIGLSFLIGTMMSKVAVGWRGCSRWQNQRHIDDRRYIVLNGGFRATSSEIRAAAWCLKESDMREAWVAACPF